MLHVINEVPKIVHVKAQNKISESDMETISALLDMKVKKKEGQLNLFFSLEDIKHIENAPFWDDIKVNFLKYNDFEKVAIVGDARWVDWMVKFGKLFSSSNVQYYDINDHSKALEWIQSEIAA